MPKLKINNINIYYKTYGQGDPLLLIHGLGSSEKDWEFQVDYFKEFYKVITFDARGHGQSDKPSGPYSMPLFASDTIELLRALGVEHAHVVGISMGGGIAMQMAVDMPEMLKSLTVCNFEPDLLVKSFKDFRSLWTRILVVRLMGMRKMGKILSEKLFIKAEHAGLRKSFEDSWAENDPDAYLAALRGMVGWSVWDQLPEIICPTLVVAADEDYMPLEIKAEYAKQLPDARLVVIEDSRHATTAEKPDEFNQALHEFLKVVEK